MSEQMKLAKASRRTIPENNETGRWRSGKPVASGSNGMESSRGLKSSISFSLLPTTRKTSAASGDEGGDEWERREEEWMSEAQMILA